MADDGDLVQALARRGVDLLPYFFTLLWRRSGGHELQGITIPDTVVLHHSRPIQWFFTSREGAIRMKSRRNLTTEAIIGQYTRPKRIGASGACSQFVRHVETASDGVEIVYQRPEDLGGFMASNTDVGLLQQYIDPKGERAHVRAEEVVVRWTPNVTYMERRVNDLKLERRDGRVSALAAVNDNAMLDGSHAGSGMLMPEDEKRALQADLDARCTAAETGKTVRTAALVSSHTQASVERTAITIAEHISAVCGVHVTGLSLHCRVNALDQVVVLRCSSLRCLDRRTREAAGMALELHSIALVSPRRGGAASPLCGDTSTGAVDDSNTSDAASSRPGRDAGPAGAAGRARQACVLCGDRPDAAADAKGEEASKKADIDDAHDGAESSATVAICQVARQHLLFPLSIMEFYHRMLNGNNSAGDAATTDAQDPNNSDNNAAAAASSPSSEEPSPSNSQAASPSSPKQPRSTRSSVTDTAVLPPAGASAAPRFAGVEEEKAWTVEKGVPAHVKLIAPELRAQDYAALRDSPSWLRELVPICLSCVESLHAVTSAIHVNEDGSIGGGPAPSPSSPPKLKTGGRSDARARDRDLRQRNAAGSVPDAPAPSPSAAEARRGDRGAKQEDKRDGGKKRPAKQAATPSPYRSAVVKSSNDDAGKLPPISRTPTKGPARKLEFDE